MTSNKLNLNKLSTMTLEHLISLSMDKQQIALALVFKEVYDKGQKDLQQKILESLPDHMENTSH